MGRSIIFWHVYYYDIGHLERLLHGNGYADLQSVLDVPAQVEIES